MKLKKQSLSDRVIALIESARQKVAYTANLAQVYTNYEIGRQIVEEEQGGKRRAGYGEKVLIDLSSKLTARFGRGWSVDNLQNMRSFYLIYSSVEIYETPSRKSLGGKYETVSRISLNTVEAIENSANSVYGIRRFRFPQRCCGFSLANQFPQLCCGNLWR